MYESQEGRQTCNISTMSTFLSVVKTKANRIAKAKMKGQHLAFLQNVDLSVVISGVTETFPHDLNRQT